MPYPDFFIVGAPKCGTTAMHAFLRGHPEVFMPFQKELHYYGSDLSALVSQLTMQQHEELFRRAEGKKCVGETCIWALCSNQAAMEIQRELPQAKIVIMLRNPVDMMHALHSEFIYHAIKDVKSFRKALHLEKARGQGRHLPNNGTPPKLLFYRDVVRYAEQVERYYRVFPRNQIHVILFDDFQRDLPGVYRRLLQFLEVDPEFQPEFQVINPNKRVRSIGLKKYLKEPPSWIQSLTRAVMPWPSLGQRLHNALASWNVGYVPRQPLSDRTRQQLTAELAPDIERLSYVLDRDLDHWISRPRLCHVA